MKNIFDLQNLKQPFSGFIDMHTWPKIVLALVDDSGSHIFAAIRDSRKSSKQNYDT